MTRKPYQKPFMKPCERCGTEFKVFHSARVRRRFCSQECKGAAASEAATVVFNCPQCGKSETLKRAQAARKRYCSAACWHEAANIRTGYTDRQGYRRITVDGAQMAEHRHVMEVGLGRKLLVGEVVHHKNGNRVDNRPENLELWSRKDPPGQRVADQIESAKDLLRRYQVNPAMANVSEMVSGIAGLV